MDIRNTSGLLDSLLLQALQGQRTSEQQTAAVSTNASRNKNAGRGQDIVTLSDRATSGDGRTSQNALGQNVLRQNQTRLVSEETEEILNGFRRLQEFESGDGRKFTRAEEFTTTSDRSRRIIVQQNNSGNTTVLENILDRQDDGSFRVTQRFTDETGESSTNIEFNVTPQNADILLGRTPAPEQQNNSPFQPVRGTEFDSSA